MSRRHLFPLALAGLLALSFVAPAEAASVVMCKPASPGTAPGPGRVTMSATGNVYQIDRAGCAPFLASDIGEATVNGFTQSGAVRAMILSGATAAAQVGTLPPAGYILGIIIENESAAVIGVGGGIKLGTTSGGNDISTGIAVSSFLRTSATDVSIAKRAFSATQATNVFVDASSWTGATVIVTVLYTFF